MNDLRTSTGIAALCLAVLLFGCGRPQDRKKIEAVSTESPPVLSVDDDADTIFSKAIQASGGKKAYSRWNCGYIKYIAGGGIMPAQMPETTMEDTFQLPGHFKRVTHAIFEGQDISMTFVVNHGKGWKKRGDLPAEAIDNASSEWKEHPLAAVFSPLLSFQGDLKLSKIGEEREDGREAVVVRAQAEELGTVDLFFSKQTAYLHKSKKLAPDSDPSKPTFIVTSLTDYEEIEGAMIPKRIKGIKDGKVIVDVTLIEARFPDKFDENTFAKP
jgi:hypothetical protein